MEFVCFPARSLTTGLLVLTPSATFGGSSKKLESLFLSMKLHVSYLLSKEDSERTRRACISYIHWWASEFFPYRLDLVQAMTNDF